MKKDKILIIGAGQMALAYAKVLNAINIDYEVVGRGEESAKRFQNETNKEVYTGGLNKFLADESYKTFTKAIIAVSVESLLSSLLSLLRSGIDKILIEKPAALSINELILHKDELRSYDNRVYVAYNRRFYDSVFEVERLISDDGGLQSMQFEFTEWTHKIDITKKNPKVLENWFFANSTHVVNLAFFLAGKPLTISTYAKSGNLIWHNKTNFAGSGITNQGVLFSYLSNWESAGRWSIELLTEKRRIFLRPLEGIAVQQRGTIPIIEYPFDDEIDKKFKPGLFKQVNAFIEDDNSRMVGIVEHISDSELIYQKMLQGHI